jgi:cytochrome c oxidase subunit 1
METNKLSNGLRALPRADRTLLTGMAAVALLALALGVGFGAFTAFARAGFAPTDPETGYRAMTGHGVAAFFYWLYFAQAVAMLAIAAVHCRDVPALAQAWLGWLGFALMTAGLAASLAGTWAGTPMLYDGSPEVVGEERAAAAAFYLGYLLLGAGLFLVALCLIATALAGKAERQGRAWSALGFGVAAWAGLVMVSGIAIANTFLPAALWALGLAHAPGDHSGAWHLLFHNLHYLPLMGVVLVWYALVRDMTGVASIFGDRFSKLAFACYLVFVPPTSLYHMFLEPGLAPAVRVIGSLLSLFIGVPTVAVFLVIVVSLEAYARAKGARGLFGWLRTLPWAEPAMGAIGMAVVNLAFGGVLAFVLIQERLAPLLSDTFFVPGYFHFLTIGTVTLTLLGAFARLIPPLSGHALSGRRLLAALPYVVTVGVTLFGIAGVVAGVQGMPRRVLDSAYDGAAPAAWQALSQVVGVGAAIAAAALLAYVLALARSLLGRAVPAGAGARMPAALEAAPAAAAMRQAAWTGPLAVLTLVVAMYAATYAAVALMRALPIVGAGGGH